MLFFGSYCEKLCLLQFSLISLIPGLIRNLQDCADPQFNSYEKTLIPPSSLRTSERESCEYVRMHSYTNELTGSSASIYGATLANIWQSKSKYAKGMKNNRWYILGKLIRTIHAASAAWHPSRSGDKILHGWLYKHLASPTKGEIQRCPCSCKCSEWIYWIKWSTIPNGPDQVDEHTVTISSVPLRTALALSYSDRRWIDLLTQAVNDTWDEGMKL